MYRLAAAVLLVIAGAIPAGAQGSDFSPSAEYHLCTEDSGDECVHDYYADSAVQFRVKLAQDAGEEELANISLRFTPGFRFPGDARIENGERLGNAHISIHSGPECMGAAGSTPLDIDGHFEERDRTEEEIADGVKIVFRLVLDPIPPIDLKTYGNARKGHRVETTIEDRDYTCPPFSFDATFFAHSEAAGVPMLRTPLTPGRYALRAIFTGTEGSVAQFRYPYKITY